jgi:hypothetical protein
MAYFGPRLKFCSILWFVCFFSGSINKDVSDIVREVNEVGKADVVAHIREHNNIADDAAASLNDSTKRLLVCSEANGKASVPQQPSDFPNQLCRAIVLRSFPVYFCKDSPHREAHP